MQGLSSVRLSSVYFRFLEDQFKGFRSFVSTSFIFISRTTLFKDEGMQ